MRAALASLLIAYVSTNAFAQTDPNNCCPHMTYQSPTVYNAAGQPQTQFYPGDTVRVRFNMINYGPEGLYARVVMTARDFTDTDFYDSHTENDDIIMNWGVTTTWAEFTFDIPTNAPTGGCDIAGSVRDGGPGGWSIEYDTTGPDQCTVDWNNFWISNQFEILDHAAPQPDTPDGEDEGYTNTSYQYTTDGSTCIPRCLTCVRLVQLLRPLQ